MNQTQTTPVDTHAHFYPCFDQRRFVAAAAQAFGGIAAPGSITGALVLAEPDPARDPLGAWRGIELCRETGEAESVVAENERGGSIALIAGRQLVSSEGLEVLALGTVAPFAGRHSVRELIARIASEGAAPVVPWGFGKWWGRRGVVVRNLVERPPDGRWFIGDSGCRPAASADGGIFSAAERAGIPVLCGSDPLPLASHEARAGSYGSMVAGMPDQERPAAGMLAALKALGESPARHGRRQSLTAFMVSQISLRAGLRLPLLQQCGWRKSVCSSQEARQ